MVTFGLTCTLSGKRQNNPLCKANSASTKTMILNGKETKTVFLSNNPAASVASSQPPIVVLANRSNHPNPMQLLPVLSSAVTSVAAARPTEVKVTESNNNITKVIYPWHSLVPFLVSKEANNSSNTGSETKNPPNSGPSSGHHTGNN